MKLLAIDFGTRFISVPITPEIEDLIDQGNFVSLQGQGWWNDEFAPNDTYWEFNSNHPGQVKVIDENLQEFCFELDGDDVMTIWDIHPKEFAEFSAHR